MLTWIFEVVLGSMNDLTVLYKSLNPEPALMMNILFSVCKYPSSNMVNHKDPILSKINSQKGLA